MLNDFKGGCPVYLACGYTDLWRGIDGLAGLVQTRFQMDTFVVAHTRKRSGSVKDVVPDNIPVEVSAPMRF